MSSDFMKWKIGDVKIDNQVVLAPMAGVCDSAFRTIVKSMGCGLIETEMVSDKAVMYGNWKSKEMLYMTEYERPISQQILGSDINSLKFAADFICDFMKPDIIDINMGCPVTKVTQRSHSGSALLKNKDKVYKIVESIVDTINIPVTVKIRSGWDENSINALEIAKLIEDAGASAITVHPRTKSQGYGGKSDWSIIRDVKDELDIPVIGNGDIQSCFDANAMMGMTGCDAVMIGRGVLGYPWLIKECVDYLDKGILPTEIGNIERIDMLKKHIDLLIKNKGEKFAIPKMRAHAAYYLKKMPKNIDLKQRIFQMNNREELFDLFEEYIEFLDNIE